MIQEQIKEKRREQSPKAKVWAVLPHSEGKLTRQRNDLGTGSLSYSKRQVN